MAQEKQGTPTHSIAFRLTDVQEVQFAALTNEWPEGELQVANQMNFACDTAERTLRCTAHFEYKKNDITQALLTVQTTFDFAQESWSTLYNLQEDAWTLPAGLMQHIADITIGASRGIMAVRTQEKGFPRVIIPLVNVGQIVKNNIRFPRNANPTNE